MNRRARQLLLLIADVLEDAARHLRKRMGRRVTLTFGDDVVVTRRRGPEVPRH